MASDLCNFITLAIDGFLRALIEHEGVPRSHSIDIDGFHQSCLAAEYALRSLFATDPGNTTVQNPYVGLFDVFHIPPQARLARPRNQNEPGQFIWRHEGRDHLLPQKYILPVLPHLQRAPGAPCMVADLSAFRMAWNIFSGGALSALRNWNNIVVAGGSVLACLSLFPSNPSPKELFNIYQSSVYRNSDIDLFLWGMNEEEAKIKMEEIFEDISSSVPWDVVCFRAKNTITIQAEYPKRPVQIIMRLYQSPAEILCGFDVDCCCVGYNGTDVFTSVRGLTAMTHQCNTIDLQRRSPSYEYRLAKYAKRGYEIFYPKLDRSRIDYPWLADPDRTTFPKGLGQLLVYEIMGINYQYYPLLYADSDNVVASAAPIPMETLRPSNYDYAWVKIPYGPKWWDVQKVKTHVEKVSEEIIRAISQKFGRRLHVHVMTCGSMAECLKGCCNKLSAQQTGANLPNGLFKGPPIFVKDDPGRQTIGSFNPIDDDDWELQAYLGDDQ